MAEDANNETPETDEQVVAGMVDGAAKGNGDGDPPGDEAPYLYAEGIPGAGDVPEWFKKDKYASISDQAKAYKDLEGRFGAFTGAPEEYEVRLSEEITEQGIEIDKDDPLMEEALKFAKDSNMSQDGFDNMLNLYAMSKVAEVNSANEAKAAELASLGDNAEARVKNIDAWGKANLGEELYEGLLEATVSASAVRTVEKLISMTRHAPISADQLTGDASVVSEEELNKMQFETDEHGNRRLNTDPVFAKKFKKLAEQVWGSEEHNITVGGS